MFEDIYNGLITIRDMIKNDNDPTKTDAYIKELSELLQSSLPNIQVVLSTIHENDKAYEIKVTDSISYTVYSNTGEDISVKNSNNVCTTYIKATTDDIITHCFVHGPMSIHPKDLPHILINYDTSQNSIETEGDVTITQNLIQFFIILGSVAESLEIDSIDEMFGNIKEAFPDMEVIIV